MSNQQIENNLMNNQNQMQGESTIPEENQNNPLLNKNMSNPLYMNNNLDMNIDKIQDQNNFLQNQNINNFSNEEIIQKINSFLQNNKLSELSTFLSSNKNKIPPVVLSNYISFILESYNRDPIILDNILEIFLSNGANVNSIINNANCQIEDQINLLMFSIITTNMKLFKLVIKYKPDILLKDKNNENSLIKAISNDDDNNPLMTQELLKLNNKAVNSTYYDQENNMTHNLLTFAASKNKKNIVALLLKNNCNINYQIPETGETAMHIVARNDFAEIAEMLIKNPNYIKDIKNNSGETPKDISKVKKGRIFFQIIPKEQQMSHVNNNSNNNLPKANEFNNMNNFNNNPNLINMQNMNNINSNIGNSSKKNIERKEKYGNNNNEYMNYGNNSQDNLIIPIEFQSVDYPTYLSMGQDIKLCLNLFQSEDSLNQQIEELEKQIKEKTESIKVLEEKNKQKEEILSKIGNNIKEVEETIKQQKKTKMSQEKQINELKTQNSDYEKLLKNLEIINENNKQNLEPVINSADNKSNNDFLNFAQSSLSEEEFKFLEQKFHTKQYDHNYIVSCLQKDLTDYQAYVKEQISLKQPQIQVILDELQSVVNEINPNYKVNLYGSYCTGLCLPWSDIDTVITCESGQTNEYFLTKLYYKLTNKPWVREHKYIENTAIPIIKLISNDKFNFHIDISEESEKHFGLKTVELVKSYLNEYKVLEPIILALKTLLNNGNLNNPYTGGLSSYGLILMVVSFIQSEIDNGKYNEKSPNILGETFLNVLGHYGIFFDYNNYVIITYLVDDSNDNNDRDNSYSFVPNSHELIIVDPLNRQNNVAKSTFQFMNIKMGFLIAFMVAKEDCECGCHYGCIQNKLDKTEHCILKRIFNSIKRFKDANKNIY